MGKKTAGTKGKRTTGKEKMLDEEASLKKVDCDWGKSSVKVQELEDLRERGLLPPLEEMKARAPGKDTVPSPRDGERVQGGSRDVLPHLPPHHLHRPCPPFF